MSMSKITTKQDGAALIISMVILAVVTVLSVSAMRSATVETKVAVNHQMKQRSFNAAESALTVLTGDNPDVRVPSVVGGPSIKNNDFYEGSKDGPTTKADLEMQFTKQSDPGEYKYSGYGLNLVSLIYQADSTGTVGGSGASTHNRMEVALIRK